MTADEPDAVKIRDWCRALNARLEGQPSWEDIRSIYLEMAPLLGAVQARVRKAERLHGRELEVTQSVDAFHRLRTTVQTVGHDIRLASPAALAIGLQAALAQAEEVLDLLGQLDR